MAIVISGSGIDMGGNPVSNASQIDSSSINASQIDGTDINASQINSTVINENGSNVVSQGELAYDVDTSSYISNTLASGAVIERGSNANGEYIKYADGTLICTIQGFNVGATNISSGALYRSSGTVWTFPHNFSDIPICNGSYSGSRFGNGFSTDGLTSTITAYFGSSNTTTITADLTAIGRWK